MLLADSIIQKLQQNQAYLKKRFGVESLVLFGSYARNTQQAESDIDLLYSVTSGRTMPLMRLQNLEHYIRELVQSKKVELVSKNHVEPIIEQSIQKEGILVF